MIWIVTDSGQEMASSYDKGFAVVDLEVLVNGQKVDKPLTREEFFTLQADDGNQMTTSQPSPAAFEDLFEKLLANEEDEILCVLLSSKLSGCFNSARIAADDNPRIHLYDTEKVCLPQTLMVSEALRLRDEGLDIPSITKELDDLKDRVRFMAVLPSLKYLEKGGRISPAKAAIAKLAGIKPILYLNENGEIDVAKKCRGYKKALHEMMDMALSKGIDTEAPIVFGYMGTEDKNGSAAFIQQLFEQETQTQCRKELIPISLALGVHSGPEGAGLAYFVPKETKE